MAKSNKTQIIPQINKKKDQKLSRQEQFFNSRIKKIRELKEKLATGKELIRDIQQKSALEMAPVEDKIIQERVRFVKILDSHHAQKFFRKKEKEKIAELIQEEAYDLIREHDFQELEEIYDKYSEHGFQEELAMNLEFEKDLTSNFIENMFGFDMSDFEGTEPNNIEEMSAFLREKMKESEPQFAKNKQKKSSKSTYERKKEKKKKVEAEELSKTTRTLYTELVKVLHPDRESDEKVREEKTEIMKKVTEAYQKDDYFELMRLQLEYLEGLIGLDSHRVSEKKLKYYNKILLEQKKELENHWNQMTSPFHEFGELISNSVKNPRYLDDFFFQEKIIIEAELADWKQSNDLFQEDKKHIRVYLKELEEEMNEDLFGFDLFDFDDF